MNAVHLFLLATTIVFTVVINQSQEQRMATFEHALTLRLLLLKNPKQAIDRYCQNKGLFSSPGSLCEIKIDWRRDQLYQSPCRTDASKRRFPPRYYRIRWTCRSLLFEGKSQSGYDEWVLFR